MRPSSEARWGVAAVLTLQLLTAAAGVSLLGRISPAVEQILAENVYSTQAVEEMLSVLAKNGSAQDFGQALDRARSNITEEAEGPILSEVEASYRGALLGDRLARERVVEALHTLATVNRESMKRADVNARRLGLAGAWAMALLGVVGFSLSLIVYRRLVERLLVPFGEIGAVLEAVRRGEAFRRCAPAGNEPHVVQTMENINWALDQRVAHAQGGTSDSMASIALVAMLEQWKDRPALISNAEGAVLATNSSAWGEGVGPSRVATAAKAGEPPAGWELTDLGDGLRLLVRGTPLSPEALLEGGERAPGGRGIPDREHDPLEPPGE